MVPEKTQIQITPDGVRLRTTKGRTHSAFFIMKDRGYFAIYRSLINSELWLSEPFTRGQAWIDLIGLANHKSGYFRKRGHRIDVGRGQVGHSVKALADRWKWSRGKVNRFLKELENDHQIDTQKTNITTLISIVNYDKYQSDGHQIEQQTDTKRTPNGHQTDTNKNDNNDNNDKKVRKRFLPPKLDEVMNHMHDVATKKNSIHLVGVKTLAEKFINYYESNGWKVGKNKMQKWKAAASRWVNEEIEKNKNVKNEDQQIGFDLWTT